MLVKAWHGYDKQKVVFRELHAHQLAARTAGVPITALPLMVQECAGPLCVRPSALEQGGQALLQSCSVCFTCFYAVSVLLIEFGVKREPSGS
jgi:hypothetical protein